MFILVSMGPVAGPTPMNIESATTTVLDDDFEDDTTTAPKVHVDLCFFNCKIEGFTCNNSTAFFGVPSDQDIKNADIASFTGARSCTGVAFLSSVSLSSTAKSNYDKVFREACKEACAATIPAQLIPIPQEAITSCTLNTDNLFVVNGVVANPLLDFFVNIVKAVFNAFTTMIENFTKRLQARVTAFQQQLAAQRAAFQQQLAANNANLQKKNGSFSTKISSSKSSFSKKYWSTKSSQKSSY